MKKVELARGIYQFIFEPTAHSMNGNNIIAILRGKKALLIDAGYEFQMIQVVEELSRERIIVEGVILSHFHQGHIEGLKALQGVTVYGSIYFKQTLEQWCPVEYMDYYTPTVMIGRMKKLKYGSHVVEILSNPGQTNCTLMIRIDENILYVADELIYSAEEALIMPDVTKENMINHYLSVYNLSKFSHATIVPGHGPAIADSVKVEQDISHICHFLSEIISHEEELTVLTASRYAC